MEKTIKEISQRYEITFLKIGSDKNHIYFLLQSTPTLSISKIVQIVKGNIAREIFKKRPEVEKQLWAK